MSWAEWLFVTFFWIFKFLMLCSRLFYEIVKDELLE